MGSFLVSGSTGQIGSLLVAKLVAAGHSVRGVTRRDAIRRSGLVAAVTWDELLSEDPPRWLAEIDGVFHLSAQTSAYVALEDPARDLLENGYRFVRLLQVLRETGAHPFIVSVGSSTELGMPTTELRDGTPNDPRTFYDVAKVCQSLYLQEFTRSGLLRGVHLQLTNVYGGLNGDTSRHRGFLNRAIHDACTNVPLTRYVGVNGRRDFLHVLDTVSALQAAFDSQNNLSQPTYLVGSGLSIRLHEVLELVASEVRERLGRHVDIETVPMPSGLLPIEMRDVSVSPDRFQADAGWVPRISLVEGIGLSIERNSNLTRTC